MTTEAHLVDERNLNHLHNNHNHGGLSYSYRFEHSLLDNNNDSIDENNCTLNSSSGGEDSHNTSNSSNSSAGGRKPSYVGLSCTVSGYSNFTRYQSPSRKTSPSAIPVSSPPQILDCTDYRGIGNKMRQPVAADRDSPPVRGQLDYDCADNATPGVRHYFPSSQTRKIVTTDTGETTVETVTRFYGQRNTREESPCSDSSSSIGSLGSGNGNSGNLVQKQIERLYGGRAQTVRLTSPEPKSPESDDTNELSDQKVTGGFFAKRFGIVKQKDYSSKRREVEESPPNHPLELKTLKVPAVFRLLRPEFREQLKLNSCQVRIPLDQSSAPPKKERIIPIVRENVDKNEVVDDVKVTPEKTLVTATTSNDERLIPIVVEKTSHLNGERTLPVITRDINVTPTSSPLRTISARSPRSPVKPALPAKPLSPTRPSRVTAPLSSHPVTDSTGKKSQQTLSPQEDEEHVITVKVEKVEDPSIPEKVIIEEIATPEVDTAPEEVIEVVASNGSAHSEHEDVPQQQQSEADESLDQSKEEEENDFEDQKEEQDRRHHQHHHHHHQYDEEEDPFESDRYSRSSTSPPCGLRERSLLCPIQEEDTESTASGCSVSVNRFAAASAASGGAANSKEPTPVSTASGGLDDAESQEHSVVIVDEFIIMPKQEAEHDGHYFIKLVENEVFQFEEQICDFEEDLANDGCGAVTIPEDIRDSILAAIGKAKLLISQKFVQFRGLCDKNISQNPMEDPFVPTSEDLAGFWDMVYLQVQHVNSLFADLYELRRNNWTPKVPEVKPNGVAPQARARKVTPAAKKGKVGLNNNNAAGSKAATNGKPQSEAAKARDEARKKMIEDKKRLMKERQQQQQQEDTEQVVEMFIPG